MDRWRAVGDHSTSVLHIISAVQWLWFVDGIDGSDNVVLVDEPVFCLSSVDPEPSLLSGLAGAVPTFNTPLLHVQKFVGSSLRGFSGRHMFSLCMCMCEREFAKFFFQFYKVCFLHPVSQISVLCNQSNDTTTLLSQCSSLSSYDMLVSGMLWLGCRPSGVGQKRKEEERGKVRDRVTSRTSCVQ